MICIFHKWKQFSPKFKDSSKYYSMSFSVYSDLSDYTQYRERCLKCGKIRIVLEETMRVGKYNGYKNKIKIPRFTVKEALDYEILKSLHSMQEVKNEIL